MYSHTFTYTHTPIHTYTPVHTRLFTCTHSSALLPCLDGRMVRRRYSGMGLFYGVIQQYDFFGDGTGGYLVNFNDGDAAHLSADEVDACLLSRHDQLAYCERRLHPDPTTSWTGMAQQVPSAALSGTKRPLDADNTDILIAIEKAITSGATRNTATNQQQAIRELGDIIHVVTREDNRWTLVFHIFC